MLNLSGRNLRWGLSVSSEVVDRTKSASKFRRVLRWTLLGIPIVLVAAATVAYVTARNACDDPATFQPRVPMKAIVYCHYGGPDVLRLVEIEKPVPADDQILVKLQAVAVNPVDWHFMRGTPYPMRFTLGLRQPESIQLGADYAGIVEAVGANVTRFKVGNAVFGLARGALAEYLVVPRRRLHAEGFHDQR